MCDDSFFGFVVTVNSGRRLSLGQPVAIKRPKYFTRTIFKPLVVGKENRKK